jgi:hypothetical protein
MAQAGRQALTNSRPQRSKLWNWEHQAVQDTERGSQTRCAWQHVGGLQQTGSWSNRFSDKKNNLKTQGMRSCGKVWLCSRSYGIEANPSSSQKVCFIQLRNLELPSTTLHAAAAAAATAMLIACVVQWPPGGSCVSHRDLTQSPVPYVEEHHSLR